MKNEDVLREVFSESTGLCESMLHELNDFKTISPRKVKIWITQIKLEIKNALSDKRLEGVIGSGTNINDVKVIPVKPIEITDFKSMYGVDIHVIERPSYIMRSMHIEKYHTSSSIEVCENSCFKGEFGNGSTPDEALKDFANKLSGKTIIINMDDKNRIYLGEVKHTKTLEAAK